MDTTIKYAALVIFLIVVIAVLITLRDGFPIGRGGNGGPIIEGRKAGYLPQYGRTDCLYQLSRRISKQLYAPIG